MDSEWTNVLGIWLALFKVRFYSFNVIKSIFFELTENYTIRNSATQKMDFATNYLQCIASGPPNKFKFSH